MQNDNYNDEYRKQLIKFMKDFNSRYLMTITFSMNMSEEHSILFLNELIKRINRNIFKGRYKSKEDYLTGYVVREITDEMNNVHYHLVIENHEFLPSENSLNDKLTTFIRNLRNWKPKLGFIDSCDLRSYYDNEDDNGGLESYLTKQHSDKKVKGMKSEYFDVLSSENDLFKHLISDRKLLNQQP